MVPVSVSMVSSLSYTVPLHDVTEQYFLVERVEIFLFVLLLERFGYAALAEVAVEESCDGRLCYGGVFPVDNAVDAILRQYFGLLLK